MATTPAKEWTLDRDACPSLETDPLKLAHQGLRDARQIVHDVRQIDPTVVWGRLSRWRQDDPERLLMALVVLAVYVPAEADTALPAWVQALAGGLTDLQPPPRIPRMRREVAS